MSEPYFTEPFRESAMELPLGPQSRHAVLTTEEIARAWVIYEQHIPSMLVPRHCLAERCGAWPCRPYRAAECLLKQAGVLPS